MNIELSLEDERESGPGAICNICRGVRGNISGFKWENFEIEGEVIDETRLITRPGF